MALNKKKKFLLYECQDLTSKLKPAFEDEEEINAENFISQAPIEDLTQLTVSTNKTCSTCGVTFESRDDQKAHFKLDWHRFNIANKLKGLKAVSEEQFEEQLDNLSLSGSESGEDGVCYFYVFVPVSLCSMIELC